MPFKDPDKAKEYRRKFYEKNRKKEIEKVIEWRRSNPERYRTLKAIGKRREVDRQRERYHTESEYRARSCEKSRAAKAKQPLAGVRNAVSKLRSGELTVDEFIRFYSDSLVRADEFARRAFKDQSREQVRDSSECEGNMRLREGDQFSYSNEARDLQVISKRKMNKKRTR